ncbi:GNAT family N-acetyltransferase [Saccharibacillus alkalitolerans]|uniref:GNAT family N-acetyltransferase n=1 Tax=Saccharibacillus alkalitolerans TaxID=2705290 RepID=A0ABX0F7L2_9BACL|nr:GNAT family N-acetyltransferase [Saccharibacillus alkalitolerans]NGZ76943.1 GNAT family N-acetyltransferase [Saccharibacillus alkalitolerans]
MRIEAKPFEVKGLRYTVRSAAAGDAGSLSALRLRIDGESENMDREPGEDFLDAAGFAAVIEADTNHPRSLFLVAESEEGLIGYSRCAGSDLKRFVHKAELGLGVRKDYWGFAVGRHLMTESIDWADANGIRKIVLYGVLETNARGIELYKKLGFEIEGLMKKDRVLSDGKFHNTYMMARFNGS